MKKIILLFFSLILCLGLFVACDDEIPSESLSSEEVPVSVKNRITGEKIILTESEAELVEKILNPEDFPEREYCDCIKHYEFRFGNYRVQYESGRVEDMGFVRAKELSNEEAVKIDAIIEKYFGETLH